MESAQRLGFHLEIRGGTKAHPVGYKIYPCWSIGHEELYDWFCDPHSESGHGASVLLDGDWSTESQRCICFILEQINTNHFPMC